MKANREYRESSPKDKRIGKRTEKMLDELSSKPEKSISGACDGKANAKAAYRLLSNDKFEEATVFSVHRKQTIDVIRGSGTKKVLIAEDTTTASYNGLKETEGLGPINDNPESRGILIHSALAITEEGQPIGLLAQKKWVRDKEEHGKKHMRQKEAIENKESYKWLEVMEEAEIRLEGVTTIHVCDRESDIYEFFCHAMSIGANFLCRRIYNRNLENDSMRIDEYIQKQKPGGTITIEVPRDSYGKNPARKADLIIKFNKVIIRKPANIKSDKDLEKSLVLYSINAEEVNPPEKVSPISWNLYTNIEITTFEEAAEYLGFYTKRWLIERFHYVLKSGCNVEKAQLKTATALMNLLCLYSIIAVEILYLTYLARTNPNGECSLIFDESEWKILYCVANKTTELPKNKPTLLEAIILLARMGGFLNRKNDGFPGVKVLWQGISIFRAIISAVPFIPVELVGKV